MELPVLHIAIGRGFSSNVPRIRMTPLSHRRFSAARVVNQHAVHEARSKPPLRNVFRCLRAATLPRWQASPGISIHDEPASICPCYLGRYVAATRCA